jgi:hypothetical protein
VQPHLLVDRALQLHAVPLGGVPRAPLGGEELRPVERDRALVGHRFDEAALFVGELVCVWIVEGNGADGPVFEAQRRAEERQLVARPHLERGRL